MSARFVRYVVIWLLLLLTIWVGDRFIRSAFLTADAPRPVAARGDLTEYEQTVIEIFQRVSPSVVYIFTQTPGQRGFFGIAAPPQLGTGSGFVWDAAGHVVTNYHVVRGATRVGVRLASGETVEARVVGSAEDYDLAVLRLGDVRATLQPIPIGSSADLTVGQIAIAIGNPFGLDRTLTTGVISALDRRLPTQSNREIAGVIQTDAAINPGNSGGPLLDSAGRLIGVNTAIYSESGAFAGVGFAVPVDTVNRVVPELIRDGRVPRPGIGILALDERAAAQLGLEGVVVAEVMPGSAAEAAGLQGIDPATGAVGDVITHAEGQPVGSVAELAAILGRVGVGNAVELTVQRNGQDRRLEVTVIDLS